MEEQIEQPTLWKHALQWGLITGGVSIGITMLLYIIDYTLMVQLKVLFMVLLVCLGLVIYAGIEYRKAVGGFLPYGKAWLHGIVILAISGLAGAIFSFILYNLIDSELPQKLTDASIENTRAMMENFGAPAESIDKALEQAKESSSNQFTPFGQVKGYFMILCFSAVLALISALFVRKNEPIEG